MAINHHTLPTPPNDLDTWPWVQETASINQGATFQWPKITIVTPSYNQGQFIEETIRSVLLQNYPNLEYIIIDGGSTDQTVDILRKYDSWITYWVSEPDKGQTHAINKGFKRAKGEIINWLNSDDLLYPGALYKIGRYFAQNPESCFIYGNCIHFDKNGDFSGRIIPKRNTDPLREKLSYLVGFPYSQPACFYRKSILEEVGYLDDSIYFGMDYDLFIRIALNYPIHKTDDIFAKFRHHEDAKTAKDWDIYFQDQKKVFSRLVRSINNQEYIEILKRFDLYYDENKTYLINGNRYSAKEFRLAMAAFLYHIATLYHTKLNTGKSKALLRFIKEFEPTFLKRFDINNLYFKSFLPSDLVHFLRNVHRYVRKMLLLQHT